MDLWGFTLDREGEQWHYVGFATEADVVAHFNHCRPEQAGEPYTITRVTGPQVIIREVNEPFEG